MKCTNCGMDFEGSFCPGCGKKVDISVSEQEAPNYKNKTETKLKKKKPFFLRWWFILLLIITVGIIALSTGNDGEKIIWNEIILSEFLPEAPASKGDIYNNSTNKLSLSINKISDKQFADYVEECTEKGFAVDAVSDSYSYTAYNNEGYKLMLSYYSSNKKMNIDLEAPMEMSNITWPTNTAGKLLPAPKSTIGKFSYENDDNFFVYVGDTAKTDYAESVKACSEKGFNRNYSKGDAFYYADNDNGWHVDIRYVGNNVMSIHITPPKEESSNTPSDNTDSETNNAVLDPDFKAAMDSYEQFMNEYVTFMKKYNNDPSNLSLIADYADYLTKYSEFVEDFAKWEDEEMNTAETAYYLEVQTRVNKKLLEVAE